MNTLLPLFLCSSSLASNRLRVILVPKLIDISLHGSWRLIPIDWFVVIVIVVAVVHHWLIVALLTVVVSLWFLDESERRLMIWRALGVL